MSHDTPLSRYLVARKIKRADFAKAVGVTPGRITQLCAGECPSLELADAIVRQTAGQVTFGDLLHSDGAPAFPAPDGGRS